MNINFENTISSKEFSEMLESVGCKSYSKKQIDTALANTMYVTKAMVDGKLAGMGRVVGDKSIVCVITDVCVKKEFQGKGIGTTIVKNLKAKIMSGVSSKESMEIKIVPLAGYEKFYQKSGFTYKPDKITGMYLRVEK